MTNSRVGSPLWENGKPSLLTIDRKVHPTLPGQRSGTERDRDRISSHSNTRFHDGRCLIPRREVIPESFIMPAKIVNPIGICNGEHRE
ncbi:hypothetical protein [uncultured Duncaniella sp.]|uniref:hypothetical protein n=1 Tax=uncultured Duncaniella sp. TaxID=2768039 RepID=UPI0025B03E4C|nr:hypothetical protein [uncultured Duncaniella sp.]